MRHVYAFGRFIGGLVVLIGYIGFLGLAGLLGYGIVHLILRAAFP
jgi:hypothetical protein